LRPANPGWKVQPEKADQRPRSCASSQLSDIALWGNFVVPCGNPANASGGIQMPTSASSRKPKCIAISVTVWVELTGESGAFSPLERQQQTQLKI
jgi:hypothetical protein